MKKYLGYIIPSAVCIVVGLFLKLALIGYGFMAYGLFAAAVIILCYLVLRLLKPKYERVCSIANKLLTYGLVLFLATLAITESIIVSEAKNETAEAEYAIVLGAGVNGTVPSRSLRARLDAAFEYAEEYPETILIVSGGKGPGEDISEAQCMYDWLIDHDIPPERVIMEDRAESTVENIRFSRNIILEREPGFDGKVCIITEGYHVMRAKLIALDNGFTHVTAAHGYTKLPVLTVNYYFREAFAFWYYMLTR